MDYLVVGLFPNQTEANEVLLKLEADGYNDCIISNSHYEILENADVDKKNGFWNWLLDDDYMEKVWFQHTSLENGIMTVCVDTEEDAHAVRDILENNGAVEVEVKIGGRMTEEYSDSHEEHLVSETVNARIVTKARNNLFFINDRRPHHIHEKKITDKIDSQGYSI